MPLPRTLKLPPAGWTLAGILAFYTLAGLFGHDPWKSDDVIHLAVAREWLNAGNLSLAGSPWHFPPLFYWSAALTGALFNAWLPLHDALRLASGLWMGVTLIALYYTARERYGAESAAAAPLLLAGSCGLIVVGHEAQPLLTLLAAMSLELLAFSCLPRKPRSGVFLLALALVLGGLGAGSAGALLLFLIFAALAPGVRQHWPRLLLGIGVAALFLGGAVLALSFLAPEWTSDWLARERQPFSPGVRLLQNVTESLPERAPGHYADRLLSSLSIYAWFSWPLWPLAGWTFWQARRRKQWREPVLLGPLVAAGLLVFAIPLLFPIEERTLMLLLPPLALLATPGALSLKRGAANALDWFSGMAISVFVLLLWLGWSAMILGWPQRLAERSAVLNPGFVAHFDLPLFVLALSATLWWIWSLLALPRSPYRCFTRWTAGLTVVWLLAVSLWLPWIDYRKSYRQLAAELSQQLPPAHGCIAEHRLGLPQLASFSYFEDLRFTPLAAHAHTGCTWLLTQGNPRVDDAFPGKKDWEKVWEGGRPGDSRERFRLYRASMR